jgi:uncharacterized protein YyaL (SSP411 family)
MLYDQAQLAFAYLEAFQITGEPVFERAARDIFTYVLRDMRHPEGGFYSAEDADSIDPENPAHKGEGAFYIWRRTEIEQLLGAERAAIFCHRFGVSAEGNVIEDPHAEFTGRNILYEAVSENDVAEQFKLPIAQVQSILADSKQILFEARAKRTRPHLDDKILTSWNALMISAFAKGAQILNDSTYLDAAQAAAKFLLRTMYSPETGRLLRRFRDGDAAVEGFLDDYAFLAQALLDLFEVNGEPAHLILAIWIADIGFARFEDPENGGFFSTAANGEALLLRIKDDYDGAEPSGNSVATDLLLRLAHITGREQFQTQAEKSLRSFAPKLKEQSVQAPQMMVALGRWLTEPSQVVVRCEKFDAPAKAILAESARDFNPMRTALIVTDAATSSLQTFAPFLANLERKGKYTVYECANFVCELPRVVDPAGDV